MGESENDIARLDERHKALSQRVDDHRKECQGNLNSLRDEFTLTKAALREEIKAISANQRWVALAVIGAVIGAIMRMVLAGGMP